MSNGGEDKRKYPRIPYRDICHIEFPSEDGITQDFEAIRNISAGGVAMEADRKIPTGSKIIIHLGAEEENLIRVKAEVVYSQPLSDKEDTYLLGIKFLAIPPNDREALDQILNQYSEKD